MSFRKFSVRGNAYGSGITEIGIIILILITTTIITTLIITTTTITAIKGNHHGSYRARRSLRKYWRPRTRP